MAITPSDFEKIWSTNASTPAYTFSDADYLEGWDFVGNLPPTRAMWNAIQKRTDEKMQYLTKNFGKPNVANTVADMTDKTKVYVYTGSEVGYTAGDWYYWDGSAWTDGGVYNAVAITTDTTLTQTGVPADAKATGDALSLKADDSVVVDMRTNLRYAEKTLSVNITKTRETPGYGSLNGNITVSSSWRTGIVNAEEYHITRFTRNPSTSTSRLSVGFYNSESTFDSSTFISGIVSEDITLYDIIPPAGTKTILLFGLTAGDNGFEILGYGFNELEQIKNGMLSKELVNYTIGLDIPLKNIETGTQEGIKANGDLAISTSYTTYKIDATQYDVYYVNAVASSGYRVIGFYSSKSTFDSSTCLGVMKGPVVENVIPPAGTKTILICNYTPGLSVPIIKLYRKNAMFDLLKALDVYTNLPYEYIGERINVCPRYNYAVLFKTVASGQDGAIYNDLLFRPDEFTAIRVYDMKVGEIVGTASIDPIDTVRPYGNSIFFGNQFYDADDPFPVLYYTGRGVYSDNTNLPDGTVYAYRIIDNGDNTYTLNRVQTITFANDVGYSAYGGFGFDEVENKLVGYDYRYGDPQKNTYYIADMPLVSSGDVTISNAQVEKFDLTTPFFGGPQGCICHNRKFYILNGASNSGSLNVVDLNKEKCVSRIVLSPSGLTGEPQCIEVYNNTLVYGSMSRIFELRF